MESSNSQPSPELPTNAPVNPAVNASPSESIPTAPAGGGHKLWLWVGLGILVIVAVFVTLYIVGSNAEATTTTSALDDPTANLTQQVPADTATLDLSATPDPAGGQAADQGAISATPAGEVLELQ